MNSKCLKSLAAQLIAGVMTTPCVQALEPNLMVDTESALRKLSEPQLKTFYIGCSNGALRGLLGSSQIALCSIGYEILLREFFGGDFLALLAWSRRVAETAHRK